MLEIIHVKLLDVGHVLQLEQTKEVLRYDRGNGHFIQGYRNLPLKLIIQEVEGEYVSIPNPFCKAALEELFKFGNTKQNGKEYVLLDREHEYKNNEKHTYIKVVEKYTPDRVWVTAAELTEINKTLSQYLPVAKHKDWVNLTNNLKQQLKTEKENNQKYKTRLEEYYGLHEKLLQTKINYGVITVAASALFGIAGYLIGVIN